MRSLNVLMILLTNQYPPDVRVEGEVKELVKRGHRVYLLNTHPTSWGWQNSEGIQILRVPAPFNFLANYFFHIILLIFIIPLSSFILDINLIHVHDLLHSIPVTLLGRICGCKIIVDQHEDYIGMCILEIQKSTSNMRRKAIETWIRIIRPLEKIMLHICTRIITVSDAETKRIMSIGISSDKITCIRNLMTLEKIKNIKIRPISADVNLENKLIISFVGGFSLHRGLETLVSSMPLILEKYKDIHLFLVGDGKTRHNLEYLVKQLNIEDYITFTGWVDFEIAMSYILACDLFVIPYIRSPQTDKALPHKIFQAMSLSKCLVVSDVPLIKNLVEGSKCGEVFKAESKEELADIILYLKDRPEKIKFYGKNGAEAIRQKYNWEYESKKLMKIYDNYMHST